MSDVPNPIEVITEERVFRLGADIVPRVDVSKYVILGGDELHESLRAVADGLVPKGERGGSEVIIPARIGRVGITAEVERAVYTSGGDEGKADATSSSDRPPIGPMYRLSIEGPLRLRRTSLDPRNDYRQAIGFEANTLEGGQNVIQADFQFTLPDVPAVWEMDEDPQADSIQLVPWKSERHGSIRTGSFIDADHRVPSLIAALGAMLEIAHRLDPEDMTPVSRAELLRRRAVRETDTVWSEPETRDLLKIADI